MFSQKYYQNPNNENAAKPSTKPVAARRRALGDITNNYAEDGQQDAVAKRPQVVHYNAPEPMDDNATVMSDRSYMQRPCDDIDSRDSDNPLLVTCYVNEMYENFNQLEQEFRVNHNYMTTRQEFINEKMRSILIDWLVSPMILFLQLVI
jgi:hypothetical protein